MKLNEIKQIVATNGRAAKLVCVFTEETAPVLEFGHSHVGCVRKRIHLKEHIDALNALKENTAFTIGRENYNDIEIDLDDFSRLHCYVIREGETFKLYDCSLYGTAVMLG